MTKLAASISQEDRLGNTQFRRPLAAPVGIFDWPVEEDVKIAKEAIANARRIRPWQV
jgi:hypothetical protein